MQLSTHTDAMYSGWMHLYLLGQYMVYLLTYVVNQFRLSY